LISQPDTIPVCSKRLPGINRAKGDVQNMTLRIAQQVAEQESVIALHGWLRDDGVAEFENVAALAGLPLCIDLEHLAGASVSGLQALLRQEERGARLSGASPYIELLLSRTAGGNDGGA
jgi:hypothetical protein